MTDINYLKNKIEKELEIVEKIYSEHYTNKNKFISICNFDINNITIKDFKDYTRDELIYQYNQLSNEKMYKDLLSCNFLFYEPKIKYNNIDDLLNLTFNVIKQYQYVVGGFKIEDLEWTLVKDDEYIKLEDNQKAIMNTVEQQYFDDKETELFIDTLIKHIKKYNANENINIHYLFDNDIKREICFIFIIFE